MQLGLTATPKRKDNVDTYAYFGEPVYIYSLKDGINDGFLTPFRVKQISTTLDEYVYTPDDKLIEGEIEAGKRYTEADFNKIIEIKEREAYRVKLFMEQINQSEKTLVFCATQDHALAVRDLINQMKTSKDPNYCQRVTANDGALGEQHLRDFQDNEKTIPTILTTSQKLSTGVDARNIRNIVLMRPINSMIEFKQIIGRGTRLYDGKDYFTIYDFVKAHHHFSDPEWDGEPLEPEPRASPVGRRPPPAERQPGVRRGPARGTQAPRRQKIKVKLADGKARTIQHMMCTTSGIPTARRCPRSSSWSCCSASCRSSSRTRPNSAPSGAPRHAQEALAGTRREGLRPRPTGRDAEDHRRREERPLRRAGPCRLRPAAADARGTRRQGQGRHQHPFQHEAAGLPRLRALALRERRGGRTRPGKADAAAPARNITTPSPTPWPTSAEPDEIGKVFAGFQKYLYQQQAAA